jgi:hypothetical protein
MSQVIEYGIFRMFRLARKLHLGRLIMFGSMTRPFLEYFKGFDQVEAVRGIFGEKTEQVLKNLKVEFTWFGGYMFVDSSDGHLVINSRYLETGNKTDIYLDLVHELCHVRQFMEGRELFDPKYSYVDRPTEIEAYAYTVKEARRLGLSDERIFSYLHTEWMTRADIEKLAGLLQVVF